MCRYVMLSIFISVLGACAIAEQERIEVLFDAPFGRIPNPEYNQIDTNSNCDDGVYVNTPQDFANALQQRVAMIVVLPGVYNVGVIELDYPVHIRSERLWEAIITGSSYLNAVADDVIIEGMKFTGGASPSGGAYARERYGAIRIEGRNVQIVDNYFDSIGIESTVADGTGITIHINFSSNVSIRNNVFRNSHAIAIKTDDFSTFVVVKNNDFLDSYDFGGAGEVLHLGNAYSIAQGVPPTADETHSVFEYNYVSNWNLELELISIKSSGNTIRNNRIADCGNSAIVIRMGNRNEITRNYLTGNTGFPVRISGEDNRVAENVFCGAGYAVSLHTERVFVDVRPNLHNSYWAAIDNVICDNVYYGYSQIFYVDEGYSQEADVYVSDPSGNIFEYNKLYDTDDIGDGMISDYSRESNTFFIGAFDCPG